MGWGSPPGRRHVWAISSVNGDAVRFNLETGAVLNRLKHHTRFLPAVGIAIKP